MPLDQFGDERVMTVSELAAQYPFVAGRETLVKWIVKGKHGVRLEGLYAGSKYVTTREAVERFLDAVRPKTEADIDAAAAKRNQELIARTAPRTRRRKPNPA